MEALGHDQRFACQPLSVGGEELGQPVEEVRVVLRATDMTKLNRPRRLQDPVDDDVVQRRLEHAVDVQGGRPAPREQEGPGEQRHDPPLDPIGRRGPTLVQLLQRQAAGAVRHRPGAAKRVAHRAVVRVGETKPSSFDPVQAEGRKDGQV